VVTFQQFCIASDITIGPKQKHNHTSTDQENYAINGSSRHDSDERVARNAALLGLETELGLGEWTMVKTSDAFTLDRKIHAAGWNFFFMAAEVKAMFFGSLGAAKVQSALKRILVKVKRQHFNGLEVTQIVARRFLGVPYVTVSAHSRHMQQSCNLDSAATRQTSQDDAEWAKG
jgi:hypothetical protein